MTRAEIEPLALVDPTKLTASLPSASGVAQTHTVENPLDGIIVDPSTFRESVSSLDFTFTAEPT